MSAARERVLAAVRAAAGHAVAHPGAYPPPRLAASPDAFSAALRAAGGEAHGPVPATELASFVHALARRRARGGRTVAEHDAARRFGLGLERARPDAPPASFEDVAVAVLCAEVGVAEDGAAAVLADRDGAAPRALAFLCQHLILLLPEEALAPDLHGAFSRLPAEARARPRLVWIAGPSKTADIEQTLVYGAHGPLGVDVVLVAGAPRGT